MWRARCEYARLGGVRSQPGMAGWAGMEAESEREDLSYSLEVRGKAIQDRTHDFHLEITRQFQCSKVRGQVHDGG